MTESDEPRYTEFVAHSMTDLLGVAQAMSHLPDGTPVRLHFRGAVVDYPDGASYTQIGRLAYFAVHLDRSGHGDN